MKCHSPSQSAPWRGHTPILASSVVAMLRPEPGKIFFDGTIGGGGHARLLLQRGVFLFATDRDKQALEAARSHLTEFSEMLELRHEAFDETYLNPSSLDGILLDLGVSSHQLDEPSRGFSFQHDGPLDMRMDTTRGITAAEFLARSTQHELMSCFLQMDDSPRMKALARSIFDQQQKIPFISTRQLASWIENKFPRAGRSHHPATLVFQALRVQVNDELGRLRRFLERVPMLLKPGGRVAIISFHSIEDRIVKNFFTEKSRPWLDTPEWPNSVPNPEYKLRIITRHAIQPDEKEIAANIRARSARLRVAEALGQSPAEEFAK